MATKTPAKSAALKKDSGKASTSVAVRPNTNVVSIKDALAAQAAAMAGRTMAPGGNKIKASPGKFTLPDGQTLAELDVVIVDFVVAHNFWPEKFDPKNIKPVACFAIGQNPKAMTPSDNSPAKQSASCQGCPMNEFGSDGDGKACKNSRKLALLPLDGDGNADIEADFMTLEVSPTAIKSFDGYVRSLASSFNSPPLAFATTIGLDGSVDYAKVTFGNPRPIQNVGDVLAKQDAAQKLLNEEPDVSGYEEAYAKKATKASARPAARR